MKFKLMTHIDRVNYFSDGFIEYYKKLFDVEDFYFLVHSYNHRKIRKYLYSHGFNKDQISVYKNSKYIAGSKKRLQYRKQREFIKKGYTLIYSSQDERIVHPNLKDYIANNLKDYMVPRGVVIIQHSSEPNLDTSKPLLSQRNYQLKDVKGRCKPQILNKTLLWDSGMHKIPKNSEIDDNIYLVDIGKCCTKIALDNNIESLAIYKDLPNYYDVSDLETIEKLFFKRECESLPHSLKKSPSYF